MTPAGAGDADAAGLARRWFPGAEAVAAAPFSGFSGGRLFLVRSAGGRTHVLKAFPPETTPRRAAWVHAFVAHLRSGGLTELPAVAPLAAGGTAAVGHDGRLWEMTDLVPGQAAWDPLPDQIAAGMNLLARVHRLAATLPGSPPAAGPSRALEERVAGARRLLEHPWIRLIKDAASTGNPMTEPAALGEVCRGRLERAVAIVGRSGGDRGLARLAALERPPLVRQAVLRDPWAAHLLFAADRPAVVVGLVDPHASGLDSPAADVARLLGSWLPTGSFDTRWWRDGLDAYEAVRPLGDGPRQFVPLLAAAGIVLGLDNWFRWILCDQRPFSDARAVAARLDRLLLGLPTALEVLENWPRWRV